MELYAWYRKTFRRRAVFGRVVDLLALIGALSAAFAAAFVGKMHFWPAAVCGFLLALCAVTAGLSLAERLRKKRFAAWKAREILQLRRRALAALPTSVFLERVRPALEKEGMGNARIAADLGYPLAAFAAEDVWQIRGAYPQEREIVIVTTRKVSAEAAALAAELRHPRVCVKYAYDLLAAEELPSVREEEAVLIDRLRSRAGKKREKIQLGRGAKVLRYLFLAGALFVLSFFTAFPLWYRLAGAACCLAAVFWLFGSTTVKEPS